MGSVKLFTPEPGHRPRSFVVHCFSVGPCSCLSPSSAQCEYTITSNFSVNHVQIKSPNITAVVVKCLLYGYFGLLPAMGAMTYVHCLV